MTIKVKVQRDYLKTEVSLDLPASVSEADEIMRKMESNGKMIVVYNDGHVSGINLEQNTKLSESQSEKVRQITSVKDKVM
jgi:hypothetical protein